VESIASTGSAGFGGVGDVIVVVVVVAVESNTPDFSVSLYGEGDCDGDDLFRDRTPHRAAIIAIVAAIPTARSENESTGGINGFSFVGTLLPMTETSKIRWGALISVSLTLFLLCSLLSLHDLFFLGLMLENGASHKVVSILVKKKEF